MKRPVNAVLLPPGPRLHQALSDALDGRGPAICPLSPDLPASALASLLGELRPAAVETPDGIRPYRPGHAQGGRDGDADRERPDGAPVGTQPDIAVLIATSGSTGHPKIVELSAAALRHSATATLARLGARPGERWLCCLPTSHIAGIQVLVRSLVADVEPVIHPRFDTATVTAATRAGGEAQHIALVPTQLRRLIEAGADLAAFRTILLGGAAAPPALLEAARERGGRIVTTYGMSETCGGCVYDGVPLDGVSIAVGADGRIRLAGPVLFTGYRRRPGLTTSVRDGEWFVTQDLGELSGGRLRVRGRADDVINTGGEKVVAGEVAAVLSRHPGVKEVVVVGRPDPEWGQRVTAVVVPTGDRPSPAELRAFVRESLPAPAAPREVAYVTAIPMLATGKPDLERLRAGGLSG